jgi:hypothetical protein
MDLINSQRSFRKRRMLIAGGQGEISGGKMRMKDRVTSLVRSYLMSF